MWLGDLHLVFSFISTGSTVPAESVWVSRVRAIPLSMQIYGYERISRASVECHMYPMYIINVVC